MTYNKRKSWLIHKTPHRTGRSDFISRGHGRVKRKSKMKSLFDLHSLHPFINLQKTSHPFRGTRHFQKLSPKSLVEEGPPHVHAISPTLPYGIMGKTCSQHGQAISLTLSPTDLSNPGNIKEHLLPPEAATCQQESRETLEGIKYWLSAMTDVSMALVGWFWWKALVWGCLIGWIRTVLLPEWGYDLARRRRGCQVHHKGKTVGHHQ